MLSADWLPEVFSQVLHRRREALGISQEELSKRSGLHRTYISDVERGARNVSLKNMGRLSAALEVFPSVLMHWAELLHCNKSPDFSSTQIAFDGAVRQESAEQRRHKGDGSHTISAVCSAVSDNN